MSNCINSDEHTISRLKEEVKETGASFYAWINSNNTSKLRDLSKSGIRITSNLSNIADERLRLGWKIVKYDQMSQALLFAASVEKNREKVEHARNAIDALDTAGRLFDEAKVLARLQGGIHQEVVDRLTNDRFSIEHRLLLNRVVALVLLFEEGESTPDEVLKVRGQLPDSVFDDSTILQHPAVRRFFSARTATDDAEPVPIEPLTTSLLWTGKQRASFHAALLRTFDESELRQMLRFDCEKRLEDYTGVGTGLSDVIFNIIEAALRNDWIGELVEAAHKNRPRNHAIVQIYQLHRASK